MKNLNELLSEIQERAEKATPGPWEPRTEFYDNPSGPYESCGAGPTHRHNGLSAHGFPLFPDEVEHDAEFIAHARQDIPALLRVIETLLGQRNILLHDNYRAAQAESLIAQGDDALVRAWEGKVSSANASECPSDEAGEKK